MKALEDFRQPMPLGDGAVIRPCTPADNAAYLSVMQDIFAEGGHTLYLVKHPDLLNPAHFYSRGNSGAWVLEVGGRIVGTVAVTDVGGGRAYLRRLALLQEYRKQGLGGKLEKLAYEYCSEAGFSVAEIHTMRSSGMYKLYTRRGFTIVKEIPVEGDIKYIMEMRIQQRG